MSNLDSSISATLDAGCKSHVLLSAQKRFQTRPWGGFTSEGRVICR